MSWTDERVELLKKLWSDGLSASQIAAELGGITRNAVIGKVHRLGLAGRAGPARAERPRNAMPRKSVVHVAAPAPPIVEAEQLAVEETFEPSTPSGRSPHHHVAKVAPAKKKQRTQVARRRVPSDRSFAYYPQTPFFFGWR